MEIRRGKSADREVKELLLAVESARTIVDQIRKISESLDTHLETSAHLDEIVALLADKKGMVDTLNNVVGDIKLRLRVDKNGRAGIPVPDDIKILYARLVSDVRELLQEEARIESLVCGKGIPISKAGR